MGDKLIFVRPKAREREGEQLIALLVPFVCLFLALISLGERAKVARGPKTNGSSFAHYRISGRLQMVDGEGEELLDEGRSGPQKKLSPSLSLSLSPQQRLTITAALLPLQLPPNQTDGYAHEKGVRRRTVSPNDARRRSRLFRAIRTGKYLSVLPKASLWPETGSNESDRRGPQKN